MKMKEVTEKTNLTERAVRLYIENGLISPGVNESYSGRRNIDFSQDDVEALRRISVLRKAGFTILQIIQMQEQPEKCKEILEGFIDKTNRRIESDREVVLCLAPLLTIEDSLDIEMISKSLDKPVMEEKELPSEDREISAVQRIIRKIFLSASVAEFIASLISVTVLALVEINDIRRYLYPKYNSSALAYVAWLIVTVALPVTVIIINRKNKAASNKKTVLKTVVSALIVGVSAFFVFYSGLLALINLGHPESYVTSHTEDVENYMVFDADGARETLLEFLPESLPDTDDIRYDYYYKEFGVHHEPPETRVFVELTLDKSDYYNTVEYYKNFRTSDGGCEPWEESGDWRGNWTIVYYREKYERAHSNYTPVFAYNNDEHKVRLICFYGRVSMKGAVYPLGEYEWN